MPTGPNVRLKQTQEGSDRRVFVLGNCPSHDNLTICTCWDADRLDLPRVFIEPDPLRLCTHEARDPAMIARCRKAAQGWLESFHRNSSARQEILHAAPETGAVR